MYQLVKAIIATVGIATVTFCTITVLPMKSYNALVSAGVDPERAFATAYRGQPFRWLVAILGCWLFMCLLYPSLWDATARIARGMIGR